MSVIDDISCIMVVIPYDHLLPGPHKEVSQAGRKANPHCRPIGLYIKLTKERKIIVM